LNGIMFWAGVALLLGKISLPNEFSELNPLMAAMLFFAKLHAIIFSSSQLTEK